MEVKQKNYIIHAFNILIFELINYTIFLILSPIF